MRMLTVPGCNVSTYVNMSIGPQICPSHRRPILSFKAQKMFTSKDWKRMYSDGTVTNSLQHPEVR
jgi:hypothetical protein